MRRFLPFRSRIITGEHLLPGYSVESSKTILAHPGNLCYIFVSEPAGKTAMRV